MEIEFVNNAGAAGSASSLKAARASVRKGETAVRRATKSGNKSKIKTAKRALSTKKARLRKVESNAKKKGR